MQNSISQKFNTITLLKFVFPSIAMMLLISVYTMTGSIYAGNYIDQDAMSGINIVAPLFSTVIAVAVMFATGANAIIARNLGEGKTVEAKEKLTYLYITAFIVGLVFTVITQLFIDSILGFLGASPNLIGYSKDYLVSLSYSFPFVFLQIFGQHFTVTIGRPSLGLTFAVVSAISNLIITHVLIVNLKVGIVGAAVGLGISFVLPGAIFALQLLVKKDWILHFVKPKRHPRFLLDVCFNGSSEMVTNLAISIVTLLLNILMGGYYGEDGIAAVTVIVSFQFCLNSMYIGYGAGVAPIFAYARGTNDIRQIKNVFNISKKFVFISSLILVIICFALKNQIVGIFIDSSSPAFEIGTAAFTIFSLGYFFAGFNIFSSVFFTAMSNGKVSALISFLRTFAFIIGMLLILPPIFGANGVWFAIPIAEFLAIIVSIFLLIKHRSVYHY